MKKTKVVHLISTSVFSGAENVACQIINLFKGNKSYEDMIYISKIGANKKSLIDRNINYYELKKFNYFEIKKAIETLKPDVIHAHDIKASVMAALIGKDIKVISHVHANHENMRKVSLKSVIYNLLKKAFYKIYWVSQSALDNYKFNKNIQSNSRVLYNIIDPQEIKNRIKEDKKEYESFDIVYLGRLTYQKNPERLMKVFNELCKKNPKFKMAIIGNGEYSEYISNYIETNKLSNNIVYFGFQSNPYKILNNSKILIMTSRYEGTPMCVLEAMSLGIPIVSTPTDGLKDIVKNDINGFLSDEDEIIITKIEEYINDTKKYSALKKNTLIEFSKLNDVSNYIMELDKNYRGK